MIPTKINFKLYTTHFISITIGFLAFFITITTNYTILEIIFSLVFFIHLLSSQYYSLFSASKNQHHYTAHLDYWCSYRLCSLLLNRSFNEHLVSIAVTLSLSICFLFSHWIHQQFNYKMKQ